MGCKDPIISVIIPVYNREQTISNAIESVLNQSYDDYELVIVDDGSEDGTIDVIKSYDCKKINVIELGTNNGANVARNKAIMEANGEYISFLDSDDVYPYDNLEKKYDHLKHLDKSFAGVCTPTYKYDHKGLKSIHKPKKEKITQEDIKKKNLIGGFSSIILRRSVFEHVGFLDESLPACQDYEFYIRLLKEYDIKPIEDTSVKKYEFENRISTSPKKKQVGFERTISKHGEILSNSRIAKQYFSLGVVYGQSHEASKAKVYFMKSIKKDPKQIKIYLLLFISIFGDHVLFDTLRLYYYLRSKYYRLFI